MSSSHPRGLLDFASVLDNDKPAILTPHSQYGTAGIKAMGIADVVHSYPMAALQPQRQVNSQREEYSSLPIGQRNQVAANVFATTQNGDISTITPLTMHLQNTIVSQRLMVRDCVKTKLFRRLKFFKKDVHGLYDRRQGTVCAMIIANCNVQTDQADEQWWADMRKLVVCTHTDRRNNVIKNMRLRFRDGMCGKIAHFKINNGSVADMEYMLDMRDNLVHYVHLIDIYAPCIVGHSIWNDKTNMTRYCRDSGVLFNDFVFSQSDEAFLLLVLLNYTETWMSELTHEQSKIQANVVGNAIANVDAIVAPKFTLSRKKRNDANGVAGIGWTEEGYNKFNELYDLVHEDRISRGATFNNELLNVFLERQRVVKVTPQRPNLRKRKTIPRDDMGSIDTSSCHSDMQDGAVPI